MSGSRAGAHGTIECSAMNNQRDEGTEENGGESRKEGSTGGRTGGRKVGRK